VTWQCKAKDGTILGTFTQSFHDEKWKHVPIEIKKQIGEASKIASKQGQAKSASIVKETGHAGLEEGPVMLKDYLETKGRLPSVKQDYLEAKSQATSVEQKGEAMPASTSVEQSQATSVEHKGKAMSASVEQSQGSSVEKKGEAMSASVEQSQATSGKQKDEATLSTICKQLSVIEKQEQTKSEDKDVPPPKFGRKRKEPEAQQSSDWLEAPKPSEWMWPRGSKVWPSTP